MKLYEIERIYNTIMIMLSPQASKVLPRSMAFVLIHNCRKLEPTIEELRTARKNLLETCMERDESGNPVRDGGGYIIDEQKATEFETENNALMDTEIDVQFDKIDMKDIELCGTGKYDPLNMAELSVIDYML